MKTFDTDLPIYPLRSLLFSLLAQTVGFALAVLITDNLPAHSAGDYRIALAFSIGALLAHSLAAFGIARFLSLSPAWSWVNGLLPLGIAVLSTGVVPHWVPIAAFAALLLLNVAALKREVPFYPSHRSAYHAVLELLPVDHTAAMVDLGCGFGSLLFFLAKRRPQIQFFGVEVSPLSYALAKIRSLFHHNVHISFGDLWKQPLSEMDFIYTFLAPPPMPRVWEKVEAEARPGTVYITNTFPVPAEPTRLIQLPSSRQRALFIHVIKS